MADQVNRYAYVGNSPLRYVDPMGREKVLILLATETSLENPVFTADGYIANDLWNAIWRIFNSFKRVNAWLRYDLKLVSSFDDFDYYLNEKQREQVVLIAHGASDHVRLNFSNELPVADRSITNDSLSGDVQSTSQTKALSSTELYLLSCNTGNTEDTSNPIAQQLQDHYGFESTYAPSTYISWNGNQIMIENSYTAWYLLFPWLVQPTPWTLNVFN